MKKILFVHHATGWGGPTNSLIQLIKELDPSKYNTKVLLLKPSNIADKLQENGIEYCLAGSQFYRKYYRFFPHSEAGYIKWYQVPNILVLGVTWLLSRYIFAGKELKKHEYDIVHLNSSVLTDWLAPSKRGGKVVIHIREPFRKGKLDVLHYFFRSTINKYADQIIAISKDNARRVDLADKTEVIYNTFLKNDRPVQESSYASKKVLYLGGSSTSKGFYTMVDALSYLDKDVKIYFGGHYATERKSGKILIDILRLVSGYGKRREKAVRKIQESPNAQMIGLVYNVGEYLSEVCCLVSPFSVPHFSRPIIEAYLQRKCAIGSDVKGMDEIILHEKTGLIIHKLDPVALAKAINSLVAAPHILRQYGEEGFNLANSEFTFNNKERFEGLYDRL